MEDVLTALQILVVDDSPLVCKKVRESLQNLKAEFLNVSTVNIQVAANGVQALEVLQMMKGQVHGIVCDWDMPEMNGIELVRQIRRTPGCWRIPILMLTSMGKREQVVEAMQAGMNDFLIKPFDDTELCMRMASVIRFDSPRVLVVDDSLMVRRIVLSSLQEMEKKISGMNSPVCFEAGNGLEALEIIRRKKGMDLIISDWKMPEMDGLEFVQHLKKEPFSADIPVIMLTSVADRDAVAEALHAGVSGFLVKPFDQQQLMERILKLLKNKLLFRKPVPVSELSSNLSLPGGRGTSESPLRVLIVDDSTLIRRIVLEGLKELAGVDCGGIVVEPVEVADSQRVMDLMQARQEFDLLIFSWRIPGLCGFDFLQLIRQQQEDGSFRALALVTESCKADMREKFTASAAILLEKPFDAGALAECVKKMLGLTPGK